jgi:tyrosyl-tRNA synthetase
LKGLGAPLEEHLAAFERGAVDLIERAELTRRLEEARASGRGLRVKFGMDASSPDLHVGHAVVLRKLRDLSDLGHTVVLLVGEATAMVGDPSGRNKLRPQLSREEVRANMETYVEQAAVVLDMERVEIRNNADWFDRLGFEGFLRLTGRMTVAQMLQRELFQKRMQDDEPIGIHEFMYPLMQGWDSVELEADVELGGTDQLFNLLVGRDFQQQVGQPPQIVLTTPLINGLDGRKMSKTYGNAIGLTEPPEEVFGKTMSLSDEAMPLWYELLTRLPAGEIETMLSGHPREAKARLAQEVTGFLHGPEAATAARAAFDHQFVSGAIPDDVPDVAWQEWPVPLSVVMREVGLATSGSEARRKITQGGVRIDGEVEKDPKRVLERPEHGLLLKVSRRYVRLTAG